MVKLTPEQIKEIKFTNLVTHTHFSIPFGIGPIKANMKRAAECGHQAFALTDSTVMSGVLEAYKLSKDKDFLKKLGKEKFPTLVGVQLNIIDDLSRKDKVNKYFTITCFAKNATGYKNLVSLTSAASQDDHFYMRPRISLPELIEHSEGLVVLSGDHNSMIAQSILKETDQEETLVQIFKEHFGEDFYIEMHFQSMNMQWDRDSKSYKDQGSDPQKTVNLKLMDLARRYDIKCVIVQNSFMPERKHKIIQDIIIGNAPLGKDGWKFHNTYFLMTTEEMYAEVQKQAPYITDEQFLEWCNNTNLVVDKCKDLKLSFTPKLPIIQYEESIVNKDPEWEAKFLEVKSKVKELCPSLGDLFDVADEDKALRTTFKIMIKNGKVDFNNLVHCQRMDVELRVIQRNGIINLCDYFLLLEDVTDFVNNSGYLRGFGRGSGAGSLVAYALDITDCDPIKFDLLFERFLTRDRVGKLNFDIPGFDYNELNKKID